MEKRTGREDGLPFPDSSGGMDLYGCKTLFEFFCDTDINEVTRTRPLRAQKEKKRNSRRRRRSRSGFLSLDGGCDKTENEGRPDQEGSYLIIILSRLTAERSCSCIMAEACSPLLLLATRTLSTWPWLSTYPHQSLAQVPFTNSRLARARHSILPRHDTTLHDSYSVISPHLHVPHSSMQYSTSQAHIPCTTYHSHNLE